jgi:colanic acid/amylovoran biosynthesis glycosyltransferase
MSARGDDDQRPVVAVFRSALFNASEGFIQDQAAALTRWRPMIVGLARKGEIVPRLHEVIVPRNASERLAFRLRGRGGCIETELRAARPALIHAHFGTDGLLVLPLARALDVPLITSLRGYDVTRTDSALLGSGRLSWMRYALGKRRLQVGGDLFLAVSNALREQAIARGYPEDRTHVHYNGVDLDRFRPNAASPAEPGLILHVGRLVEKKGTKVLIKALAELSGAKLAIIGDGPLRSALKHQAREFGERVHFLGELPSDEVAQWMRRASVLAVPSLTAQDGDAEGLPNVVVEAAASGLPVVGSKHSGIPEAIEDGASGFLVSEGDAGALATRLADLLGSEPLRREMGAAARRLAQRKFDRQMLTTRLESIYDEVTGFNA